MRVTRLAMSAHRWLGAVLFALVSFACDGQTVSGELRPVDQGAVPADAGAPLGAPDLGVDLERADAALTDASASDASSLDAGSPDSGVADAGRLPAGPSTPSSIFFIGNSFTMNENIPDKVRQLVVAAGFPEPEIGSRLRSGWNLTNHRNDQSADGAPTLLLLGWDAVVIQEFSTRPTDSVGPAGQFKEDAVWLYDQAKMGNPEADVVLYQTWARRFDHNIYPGTFTDPTDMQAQLRFHYEDAVDRVIPQDSMSGRPDDARLARVGDAWEIQLAGGEPPRLHAADRYHQGPAGAYLNALVLFGTLYRVKVTGAVAIGVSPEVALELQQVADEVTGFTRAPPALDSN